MGERVAQMEGTRERIIEAAIALYEEVGISATTMRELAARADVAPGTLRRYFASRDDLDRAMVERLTAEAPLPELSIFDGAPSAEDRVERLIVVAGTFFDRSRRLQRMWARERMLTPVWTQAGVTYGTRWEQLFEAALGPMADDPEVMAIVRAVITPTFFDSVRTRTATTEEASSLVSRAILPWLREQVAKPRH